MWPFSAKPGPGNDNPKRGRIDMPAMRLRYGMRGLEAADATQFGYRAAKLARKQPNAVAEGGAADSHLWEDLDILRRQSQEFDRDNGLYRAVVERGVEHVLGESGFGLQAKTDDEDLNREIEAQWDEFADDPEVRGLHDWSSLERLVLRHIFVDGDVGNHLVPDDERIQIVEGERIGLMAGTPAQALGLDVDRVGRPLRYHVADYDQWGNVGRTTTAIDAANFTIIGKLDRISQTRGVPALACNFPMFHRINDVLDSEAIAWQLLSRLAFIINRQSGQDQLYAAATEDTSAKDSEAAQRYLDFGDSIIMNGRIGEEVKAIERNIPGQNFPDAVRMFLRILGLPVGLPLELMLLDYSQTSYSSGRLGLNQVKRTYKAWQRRLLRGFHRPVYAWWIGRRIAGGKLPDRPDIGRHEWFPPPWEWPDPQKEMDAVGAQLDRGIITYAESLKDRNKDRADILQQREIEVRDAIGIAQRINTDMGVDVPWQMFAGVIQQPGPAGAEVWAANQAAARAGGQSPLSGAGTEEERDGNDGEVATDGAPGDNMMPHDQEMPDAVSQ